MTLVIFSMPFWRPRAQMPMQRAMTIAAKRDHQPRIIQHPGEKAGGLFGRNRRDLSRPVQERIVEHPAGDHGVEHHEQIVSGDAGVFGDMPAAARLFQDIQRLGDTPAAATADGEFTDDDGQSQQKQAQQVNDKKSAAAVFAADIGKFPDIAQTNGAPGRYQDKAQP